MFACVAAPYVKVYLMDNGKCVLKRRTRLARKTLDPLYQQQLQFEENPEGKVLQVKSVKKNKKRFLSNTFRTKTTREYVVFNTNM